MDFTVRTFLDYLARFSLGQQLALTASLCCLLATLTLVALSAKSSRYTQDNLQRDHGEAVVAQLARRLSTELAVNDRLGVAGELNQLVEQASVAGARALGVEGKTLAVAGNFVTSDALFQAAINVAGDRAGTAEISLNTRDQNAAQFRLQLALSGLAILLSIAVYIATRAMAHRLASNLSALSAELASVTGSTVDNSNEVTALRAHIAALPLDLLKPPVVGNSSTDHYVDTAILYLYFRSLPGYVDTVDEQRLQHYVATVHRLIYGAAGFYDGTLEVVRQFGLAVFFTGSHSLGSPALRAASCAWLIQKAAPDIEKALRLSVSLGSAVGGSELGRGDAKDIYPGLYTQSALDELHQLASNAGNDIKLAALVLDDIDLSTRMGIGHDDKETAVVGAPSDTHRDLIERQLQVLLRALLNQQEVSNDHAD